MFSLPSCVAHPNSCPHPSTVRIGRASLVGFLALLLALGGLSCAASAQKAASPPVNLGTANVCPSGTGAPAPCSQSATLTFKFTAADTGISTSVVTQGATGLDFTDAGGGTCDTNGASHSYANGDTCTVKVKFAPLAPGTRMGAVLLNDSAGIAATAYVSGYGTGPQIASYPALLRTMGGWTRPTGIAIDASGYYYVTDSSYNRPVNKGAPGCYQPVCFISLGGGWDFPVDVAVDGAGNVYVTELYQALVKKTPLGCTSSGCVTPLGGGFDYPWGIALDGSGNIYVADSDNNAVKEMPPGCASSSCVTTLGGGFNAPKRIALDSAGNVYVADTGHNAIKKMSPGCASSSCVSTLGGGFNSPVAVALDAANTVYVLDDGNLKAMPYGCTSSSCVTTLSTGFSGADGLVVDSTGNVHLTETPQSMLAWLEVSAPPPSWNVQVPAAYAPSLSFAPTQPGLTSSDSPQTATVRNTGNSGLNITSVDYPTDFPEASGVNTDCTPATELEGGTTCTLSIDFSPLLSSLHGASTQLSESVALTDNNLNQSGVSQQVDVAGTEVIPAAALTSPTPSSVLAGPSATFIWGPVDGATGYTLQLGTTQGGKDLYGSGTLTTASVTVSNLPTNGETIYARLSTLFSSTTPYIDCTFTAAKAAALTSPASNSILGGSAVTFKWSAATGAVSSYILRLGTTQGGYDLYGSGPITTTSVTPTHLPTNGETIYARLYTLYGSIQVYTDYAFTAATVAALTSPAPNSTLAGPKATFTWGAAPGAFAYILWIGTSPGAQDLYASMWTADTAITRFNLPINGKTIYVRLTTIDGAHMPYSQVYNDYVYTAATPAALTSPANNTTLAGSKVTFNWSAATGGASSYILRLGTTQGANNLFGSGQITATTVTPTKLPTNGETIYARLLTIYSSGAQVYIDYTFTAAP